MHQKSIIFTLSGKKSENLIYCTTAQGELFAYALKMAALLITMYGREEDKAKLNLINSAEENITKALKKPI